jgi:centromeric protein E
VSYLEVYNEQVKDLFNTGPPCLIKIQHGAKVGTIISGIKEEVVCSAEQVLALLRAGEALRHVGSTDMNDKSSRAHILLRLLIESKERQGQLYVTPST